MGGRNKYIPTEKPRSSADERILIALSRGSALSLEQLKARVGGAEGSISSRLQELRVKGLVESTGAGITKVWRAVRKPDGA